MTAVPAVMPVTIPVEATDTFVFTELHVPPLVALLRVRVAFSHMLDPPVIADGSGFTVTMAVTLQPVPNE